MELSRDVMLGMIRQGQNGDQLLQILDVITSSLNEDSTDSASMQDAEVETVHLNEDYNVPDVEVEVDVNEAELTLV